VGSSEESSEEDVPVRSVDLFHGWSVGDLSAAQKADPHIGPVFAFREASPTKPKWEEISSLSPASKAYMAQWDRMEIQDGVLTRRYVSKDAKRVWRQTVLPKVLREDVLKQLHDSPFGGHFGVERTLAHVQHRFYWYDMQADIGLWCKTCEACAAKARPLKKLRARMGSVPSGGAFERIAADIMGPLQETDRYNSYILVVSDYYTKWTEAYPLPNQEATTVADAIVREWVPRFGAPRALHSDQGSNFESATFRAMCELLGIDKTRTTPFHPQSDGQVERFNATVQGVLAKTSERCHFDWDLMLPFALMAYRATPHKSTGLTPNMMVLGREITEPIDLVVGLPSDHPQEVSPPQYVVELRERLEQAHEIAREALGQSSRRAKKHYDRKAHEKTYAVGDFVWQFIKNRKRCRGKVRKFLPNYDGPYRVQCVVDPHTYVIQRGPCSNLRVVHHDDLKPYYSREALEERWSKQDKPGIELPKVSQPPGEDSSSEGDAAGESEVEISDKPDPRLDGSVDGGAAASGSPVSVPGSESGGGSPCGSPKAVVVSPTAGPSRPKRRKKSPSRYGDWVRSANGHITFH